MFFKEYPKLPFNEFSSIYSRVPRLCVDLIIRKGPAFLLTKRDINPGKGLWHLPGGTLMLGESIENAIKRIAFDETGLVVHAPRLLGTIEFCNSDNLFFHAVSIGYEVQVDGGKIRGSEQANELQFFTSVPLGTVPEQAAFIEENYS